MSPPKQSTSVAHLEPLWMTTIDQTNWNEFFDVRYAVRGPRIYYLHEGRLTCADTETGHVLWSAGSRLKPPLILGNGSIFAGGSGWSIAAFDALTGSQRWIRREPKAFEPIALLRNAGLFALSGEPNIDMQWSLDLLDPNTGKPRWRRAINCQTPTGPPIIVHRWIVLSCWTSGAIMGAGLYFYDLESGATFGPDSNWFARPLAEIHGRVVAASTWPGDAESHHPLTLGYIGLPPHVTLEERLFAPDLGLIRNSPQAGDYWASGNDLFLAVDGRIYKYSLLAPPDAQQPLLVVGPSTPRLGADYAGRTGRSYGGVEPIRTIEGPFSDLLFLAAQTGVWRLRFVGQTVAQATQFSSSAALVTQIVENGDRLVVASDDGIAAFTLDGELMSVSTNLPCRTLEHLIVSHRIAVVSCAIGDSDKPYRIIVVPIH
jgi:hypothetical protein